jgi:2-phospho-L-lactate/phosphoenolpyruvate guanylyltransferase
MAAMPTTPRWSVVVPVKRPEVAKTRLADLAGARRAELARAFAADTVAAALACPDVVDVVVVTDDAQTATAVAAAGAVVVADEPAAGLNAALRHGADLVRRRHPDRYIAALSADLPALRPEELATTLRAATAHPVSFVGDAAGIGTTLYAVTRMEAFEPRFGGRSRATHRAGGAVELTVPDTPSVHRDVDTAVDLWDALRLGVGPRTAAVVALI